MAQSDGRGVDHGPTLGTRPDSRRLAHVVLVLITAVGVALAVLAVLTAAAWPGKTVLGEWQQPAAVSYADGSRHTVAVIDRGPRAGAAGALLGDGPRYQLYAGRDPSHGYGHFLDLDVPGAAVDQATVEWTAEGVRLRFPGGQEELFVPADAFVGGR